MEQGPTEKQIIEQAVRQKMPLPARIQNKPTLLPGLEFYYSAFWELMTCRSMGMAEGPIPWTAIHEYAVAHGINDPDELDRLSAIIKRMDIAYLDYKQKKEKNSKKNPKVVRSDSKATMKMR